MNQKSKIILVNLLTLLRILLVPLFLVLSGIWSFLLLNFLFLTDFFDGYISRKFNLTTKTGAILDLVGDKFLTIFLLVYYYYEGKLLFIIIFLLIFREVYSMVLRVYYLFKGKELIEASIIGKLKTALIFIAFDFLIFDIKGYQILFVLIIIISYYSLVKYIIEGFKRGKNNK